MSDDIPNEIIVEVTRRCNLDCRFCFINASSKEGADLPLGYILPLLDEIKNAGIGAVRFTGGEPLLREDLKHILAHARGLGLYVIMNSNALLLDASRSDIINLLDLLLISFHDTKNFPGIKSKLLELSSPPTEVMLATILTKGNIRRLDAFYSLVKGLPSSSFKEWFFLRPLPNEKHEKPMSLQDLHDAYDGIVLNNARFGMDIKIANAVPFCATGQPIKDICKGGWFDSGYSRLYVDAKGLVRESYLGKALGDIRNDRLMEMWNSQGMQDLRAYKRTAPKCRRCHELPSCKGGLLEHEYLFPDSPEPLIEPGSADRS